MESVPQTTIVVDATTLEFTTWKLKDLKDMCIVGNAFLDRCETAHAPVIQTVLHLFLAWYDSHWRQPENLPAVIDEKQIDWIQFARIIIKRKGGSNEKIEEAGSCEVM